MQHVQSPCAHPEINIYYTWYYTFRYEWDHALRFFLPDVHVGDTLGFVYHGSVDIPATSYSDFDGVSMQLSDSCYYYFEGAPQEREICTVKLGVITSDFARFGIVAGEDTISHGDTTALRAVAVDSSGGEVEIDSTILLRYVATPDTLGSFIDASGLTVPSPLVNVRYIDARLGRIKFVANGSPPDSTLPVTINVVQQSDTTKRGSDTLYVKPSVIKILLGETKYYRARNHPTQTDKLIIEETQEPVVGDAIADSVWRGTPLSVVEDTGHGRRMGVYWDLKTATIQTDTLDPIMNNLPLGLIRVIGRYWDADSIYKVRLRAEHDGRSGGLVLEVKRPDRLGTTHNTVVGPTILNGVDSTWNLDSLIIYWAGKEGILPQIIKGIIRKESISFYPSYRYEPFADLTTVQQEGSFDSTHRYWIRSSSNLGNPTIPQHNNIHIATNEVIQYPGYRTVWEYYSLYNTSLYTRRVYENLRDQWDAYFSSYLRNILRNGATIPVARVQANVLAETSFVHWLQDSIGGLGMLNTVAQTRIAASFGLMQLTYYGGTVPRQSFITWGYNFPSNDPEYLPEYINIPRIGLKYGVLHFKGWLRLALGGAHFSENSWPGLEYAYWWGLKRYNGKKEYPNPVFGYANTYLPRRLE